MRMVIECIFFFFQAEDGIRDTSVTGVQTCALPIYVGVDRQAVGGERDGVVALLALHRIGARHGFPFAAAVRGDVDIVRGRRSEERRVGKEGRWRWRGAR